MLGKLFGTKAPANTVFVLARLNDRAQPMQRGILYEDPLHEVLEHHRAGGTTGGGTHLGADSEIQCCEVEIEVREPFEENLALVKNTLEENGAPKGSMLIVSERDMEVPFGLNEGLAVYLNGTDLPDEVYAECDLNFVVTEFARLLDDDEIIHDFWQGPTETALYIYGPSFERMKSRLAEFLDSYPLCQRARVLQIA